MFFKWEKLNPNTENCLAKAIGLKLYHVIYRSITLFIANLICLANIPMVVQLGCAHGTTKKYAKSSSLQPIFDRTSTHYNVVTFLASTINT